MSEARDLHGPASGAVDSMLGSGSGKEIKEQERDLVIKGKAPSPEFGHKSDQ